MVVEVVGQSIPTSEVCSSYPVIGKVYIEDFLLSTVLKRRKYSEKRPGMAHFKTQGGNYT